MVAMHRLLTVSLALSFAIGAADLPESKQWAQFRGPGSTGVADDPALPDKWSQTENVAWKTAIPGVGWLIKFLDTEGNLACAVKFDTSAK